MKKKNCGGVRMPVRRYAFTKDHDFYIIKVDRCEPYNLQWACTALTIKSL